MDKQSSNLSNRVRCSRCARAPHGDVDFVEWVDIDEAPVCPGCLTMIEIDAQRARR